MYIFINYQFFTISYDIESKTIILRIKVRGFNQDKNTVFCYNVLNQWLSSLLIGKVKMYSFIEITLKTYYTIVGHDATCIPTFLIS